jgi:hypothetical protein
MNPNPPIDQDQIPMYMGTDAEVRDRLTEMEENRPHLRKWHIPSYQRLTEFPPYETQMILLFQDAQIEDVALGRALRPPVNPNDNLRITRMRKMYDEANLQIFTLTVLPVVSLLKMEDSQILREVHGIKDTHFGIN